ncbi:RagB/SusD family nutrient uptake outer membrane protein [uncultured Polaribacter sp.]|uniref:RagB/SusD family nutrient uptake outer membrane protein n=1 Tax=uncultured Polaribacter sp. TaxID=174711 RepID=UPI00262EE724|nr:RagB/SusD family nutrient uptake outer membrane protein [uncultured Polaribacter sp.]
MKTKKHLFALILASIFFSCEDYLDKVQGQDGITQEDVFTDVRTAEQYIDAGYFYLITEVSAKNNTPDILPGMTMSGEGYPGRFNNNVQERYQSYANSDYINIMNLAPGFDQRDTPNMVSRYFEAWKGIRVANTFLENVDLIANADEETINGLKGQAYFIKSFLYHLLTKRHGGLLYLENNLDLNQPFNGLERESYESNLENILNDVERAIEFLPVTWNSTNTGRPTKGAAMALKSRILLFAASPLVNTTNDQQKWVAAAEAAAELINFSQTNGLYTLKDASGAITMDVDSNGTDLFVPEPIALEPYRSMFVGPGLSKDLPQEAIFMEYNDFSFGFGGRLVPFPRMYLTAGFDIVKGNNNPMNIGATANFVDKFETKNGLPIEDDPSYNDQEPFINRDPRFYNAILYDGIPWTVTTSGPLNSSGFSDLAVVNENGVLGLDLHNPATAVNRLWQVRNTTGYRIRKWVPNGFYLRSGGNGEADFYVNNIIFRMAEIYLNYAEAANEAYGPGGVAPGANLTALDAVNIIRNRVGMPNVNGMYAGSQDLLRERIRNERAIELCFEGFRYDDIRRWKTATLEENKIVEFLEMRWQGGPSALYPTGFSFENVEQTNLRKTFDERNYWWPIPASDLEAAPSLGQTPGW